MSKLFRHYFPKKEALKSKIFRKILFSFIYIVFILFLVFNVYFYYRIYKKELNEFLERAKSQTIHTVRLAENFLFLTSQKVYELKNEPDLIKVLDHGDLENAISSFFERERIWYQNFSLFDTLIIADKKKDTVLIYDFHKKSFSYEKYELIKSFKDRDFVEKDGVYFSYPSTCTEDESYLLYYFSLQDKDVYIKIFIPTIISILSKYVDSTEGPGFVYTKTGKLIYKFYKNKGCIKYKKTVTLLNPLPDKFLVKKTPLLLIMYNPFRVSPFEISFVYVKLIPIYVAFKWSEYKVMVGVFLFFSILLSFIFSNLILKQLISPLQTLKEAVVRIAQGDFRRTIELSTNDEFEELANAINVMVRRIEDLYLNLEEEVKKRTEELERQKYRLKKLYELSFIFFKDKDEMLKTLLESLIEILEVEIVSVSYKDKEGQWKFLSFVDKKREKAYDLNKTIKELKFDEVVYKTEKPLVIRDTLVSEEWKNLFAETQIRSYMGVPIFINGKIYGVLSVINRYPYEFSSQDLEIVSLFTQRISYFLETELWEKRIIEKQRELEELNNLLYMKNVELLRLAEDLKRANKAKSDFLANVSHELRTPLNAILGFSEVLLEGYFGKLNEKQEEYLKDILESGRHLLDLINDILDLSKIEAGKEELHLTKVDLYKIIASSFILVKEKALRHSIKTFIYHDERIKEVVADELKLKQILFNLLSNAVKFTPDGGKVGVVTREMENWYRISVWDTGIGIKKEDLRKLFKEFSQVENPYTKKYKGTGLGLALSRRLVEMHGGFIKVTSVYGKGSTFSVFLPKNLKENVREDEKKDSGSR